MEPNTADTIELSSLEPLQRREGTALGAEEYRRFVGELEALTPADWNAPTDCEGWTVRDLAGHLAGSMHTATGLRALAREQRHVKRESRRSGEAEIDVMARLQVASVATLSTSELTTRMRELIEPAIRGRSRLPLPLARAARFRVRIGGLDERWDMAYLTGTILTRDTWLHRVADLARAVGRSPRLDDRHDARIVGDIAAEWARRHRRPVELILTGEAGGHFRSEGGPGASERRGQPALLEMDAIEFCRVLSGRSEPTHELLRTEVAF